MIGPGSDKKIKIKLLCMTTLLCIKKTMNDYLTILHVNNGLAPPGVRIFPSGDWTLRWLALGWDLDLGCGDGGHFVGRMYSLPQFAKFWVLRARNFALRWDLDLWCGIARWYLGGHILPCAKCWVLGRRSSAIWSFNQPFAYQVTRSKYN